MSKIIPPFCLLMALLLFIAGFALLTFGQPAVSTELHAARISEDEAYRDVLEEKLKARQLWRNVLIGALFATGTLSVLAAFWSMRPAGSS